MASSLVLHLIFWSGSPLIRFNYLTLLVVWHGLTV